MMTTQRQIAKLALLFATALAPLYSQIDRGTIQGVVTDPSGAVIPGAKVTVTQTATNSTLDFTTNSEGIYIAANLPVATYRVTFEAKGFGSMVREPVEVRSRVESKVDAMLQPGSVTESVNVTAAAPLLDTAAINNSASMKSDLIQELPLIVVGSKRDITGFLNNLPGTTGTNTFVPSVNASPTGLTEAFIDGAPAGERIQRGAISENGPVLEQVGEVNVVTSAFNAEYGGFGNWFTSVTIKSGTNTLHGSIFDHLGNDKLNARAFFQPRRTPYRQNEGGFTLGGPLVIPGVYNGRNKTFFFGSLGVFFSRYGASNQIVTIPTQDFVKGNFSGLVNAAGVQIPIFDPDSTVPAGTSYQRTQFPDNIIPANKISSAGRVVAPFIPPTSLPGAFNNYYAKAPSTWTFYNTWTPLLKMDHSISNKQKLQGSWTLQRRPRIIWQAPQGYSQAPAWGQPQTNPLDNVFDQQANSWKLRFNHDYIFSPTVLNHLTLSADRYYNLGINKTSGQGWNQKMGITGIPADMGEFPAVTFSGGTAAPVNFNRGYDEVWHDLRYSIIENLSWIRGKHAVKFGIEIDRDRINRSQYGGASGTFGFTNSMTSQPNAGGNYGLWGNAFASFLVGGVSSASAYVPVTTGVRYIRYGMFAQDEWRATSRLTLSYGLRWDYMPMYNEVQDKMSSFVPSLTNPGAGGRKGALGFAGSGAGRMNDNFVDSWKKGFGPRLGVSYQLNDKTVIRGSGGIYYANYGGQGLTYIYTAGFSGSPAFSSPDGFTPIMNIGPTGGKFPQNFVRPPSLDPTFLNGQAISLSSRDGARLPQTVNWTVSVQRQLAGNLSLEGVYLGSRTTHLNFNANYNYLPISYLPLQGTLLQPITSPAAAAAGISSPFPGFENQLGANTVYQALRTYPMYTGVTTNVVGDPAGQQKFNSLQVKANKRFSAGLTLFGFFTWMKSFSLVTDQYPGNRLMQLDANPAAALSFSWAYDLPFGKGKQFARNAPRWANAAISGWKVNGFLKYSSGVPLGIAAGAGNLGAIGYTQRGNAVSGVSPYLVTNPRDFTPTSKYLNSAAFTTSTGFNFGNLAPVLSWVRGFWSKQEAFTIGRVISVTEKLKLDVSADAVNPFNFHRWNNPNTTLTSAAFGTVTGTADGRTLQINAAVRF